MVRRAVEARLGTAVSTAASRDSGFTPGFASVLDGVDGSRHFVKAASATAQPMFAASYREEIRKLSLLPDGVPAPRLLWSFEEYDWVVLSTEFVEGAAPERPWRTDQLEACLDALEETARLLTPCPDGLVLDRFEDELADWPQLWDAVGPRYGLPHTAATRELADLFAGHCHGETVVHTDVRDDNLLLRPDGAALLCDWNWPSRGAAWLDSFLALIGPRGDGLDVDDVLARRPVFAEVPAEAFDSLLALITGYFLHSAAQPVPGNSPHIRDHQRWQGEVTWQWLCERRGWPPA